MLCVTVVLELHIVAMVTIVTDILVTMVTLVTNCSITMATPF